MSPFTTLCLLSLSCASAFAQSQGRLDPIVPKLSISEHTEQVIAKIIGDTLVHGQAYEYDRELADDIGPRLTGSANYFKAVQWSMAKFKDFGLTNVHTETFQMDTWEPDGPAVGKITAPTEHLLHIYSFGWTRSTPVEGVKGRVVFPHVVSVQSLNGQREEIRGSVVVLDFRAVPVHVLPSTLAAVYQALEAIGPAALLTIGGANGTEVMSAGKLGGKLSAYPVAEIGSEDGSLLRRLTDRGPVTIEMAFKSRTRRDIEIPQVIAEIKGSELPDQVVIVSSHLDSWQPGTGAQDNGTGVATVLDAARELQSLGRAPKRTIRFILFGGEEEYLVGSSAYVRQHAQEMNRISAMINTDSGSETAHGWILLGRDDEGVALSALKPLLSGLGSDGTNNSAELLFLGDFAGFQLKGAPTLLLWTDLTKYWGLHHQASDTFDSVNKVTLLQGDATVIATTYAIANSDTPFASHYGPAEMIKLLEKDGAFEEMQNLRQLNLLP
jgi:hypothetical protein